MSCSLRGLVPQETQRSYSAEPDSGTLIKFTFGEDALKKEMENLSFRINPPDRTPALANCPLRLLGKSNATYKKQTKYYYCCS